MSKHFFPKKYRKSWKKFYQNFRQLMEELKNNPAAIWLLGLVLIVGGLLFVVYPQILQAPTLERPADFYSQLPGEDSPDSSELSAAEPVSRAIFPAAATGNRLEIPKMGVAARIHEGDSETLNKGVWLLPRTSTPDQGGNTVITAHRWLYRPPDPRTFYLIDQLEPNDLFTIHWQAKTYIYEVYEVKLVRPEQTEILYPTKDPIVTLFTCAPLFSTDYRQVVRAKLIDTID